MGAFTPIAYGLRSCADPSHNIAFFTLIRRQSLKLAELTGFEPVTSRVTGERSNHLSYSSS